MNRIASLCFACCLISLVMFFGCTKENSTTVETPSNPGLQMYTPKGTITGKIIDGCTNAAVAGAVISVGYDGAVQSTVSDISGSFSFANVPAGRFSVTGGGTVVTGTYTFTASLVNYNTGQADTSKRFHDYYYNTSIITFTTNVPGDSLVSNDLVGSVVFTITHLNTTLEGTVVDGDMQPVSNALVTLYDQTVFPPAVLKQATSGAEGEYLFSHIDNGLRVQVKVRSGDGTLDGISNVVGLPCNIVNDSLRAQVTAEQIVMLPADDVAPMVIGITPANNADVATAGLQIVYTFSEPIKQTAYTRTDLPEGHKTLVDDIVINFLGMKKTSATVPFTVAWNAAYTQLTVTPAGIVGSSKYQVSASGAIGQFKDMAGNAVGNNTAVIGDFELLAFTTAGSSPLPAAPVVTREYIPGAVGPLDWGGGSVFLEWNYDANARSYNVYRSVAGGTFELIAENIFDLRYGDAGVPPLVYPDFNHPMSASNVRYQVRGESNDLAEGPASNIITIKDDIAPRLLSAAVGPDPSGAANAWVYVLRFSEPLPEANSENTVNYSFLNTSTVSFSVGKADYIGLLAGTYQVWLQVATNLPLPAGYTLQVNNGFIDLAGNPIDANFNKITF